MYVPARPRPEISAKLLMRFRINPNGQNRSQTACKPGSVRRPSPGEGWPFLWDACRQAPRATDPGGGAEARLSGEPDVPPLFGLAPGGVCHAATVAGSAVRSYRTLSPLPQAANSRRRFAFCCTFPGVAPAGRYPAPMLPWSPDFPRPSLRESRGHPAVWLGIR